MRTREVRQAWRWMFVLGLGVLLACSSLGCPEDEDMSAYLCDPAGDCAGQSYTHWGEAFWQWATPIPAEHHPLLDLDADCDQNQSGDAFFLSGMFTSETAKRDCPVSQDKHLVFPLMNTLSMGVANCTGISEDCQDCSELVANTSIKFDLDEITIDVTLDDTTLEIPASIESQYYVESSDCFDVHNGTELGAFLVGEDNCDAAQPWEEGNACGYDAGPQFASMSGWYGVLEPLPAGDHELRWEACNQSADDPFCLDFTYNLTIQ